MRHLLITTALIASLIASLSYAETATPSSQEHRLSKEEWEKLTPDQKKKIGDEHFKERQAERAEWKKKYDAATPEEKAKMRAELDKKHQENKAKWKERYDKASPEEKKAMEERTDKRRERRAEWRKEHGKKGTASNPTPAK